MSPRGLVLDDGLDGQNPNAIAVPFLGADGTLDAGDTFRMGDEYTGLTGVLIYNEGSQSSSEEPKYRRLTPTEGVLTATNPRPDGAPEVSGMLTVASFNVLNFFTTIDLSGATTALGFDPRGADSDTEFARQLDKLLDAITGIGAGVFGLVKIENDVLAGAVGNPVEFLVDRLNALGTTPVGSTPTAAASPSAGW